MDGVTLLDFAPRARYSKCFLPSCARNVRSWNNRQKSFSYKKKLWNILKSKARLLIWAIIFQYSNFKLLDLGSNLKHGPFILSPNAAFYAIIIKNIQLLLTRIFFSFKYISLVAKTNKKGDHRFRFLANRQQRGNSGFKWHLRAAGTRAGFKPNTILTGKS